VTCELTLAEEDGFSGVHARQGHDVQVGQPCLVGLGDGQQVLQVPDLRVDLVPARLGRSFGRAVHGGEIPLGGVQ